jgi:hypothetical protein
MQWSLITSAASLAKQARDGGTGPMARSWFGGAAAPATRLFSDLTNDQTVYLVADDFGKVGRAWREADYEATYLETVIKDLLSGEHNNDPRRCLQHRRTLARRRFGGHRRCDLQMREVPAALSDFVDLHQNARQLTL